MENDVIFRIMLALLFVAFIAHRGYYSRKIRPSDENTVTQRQGGLISSLANLLSLPGLVAVAIYIVYPPWMSWAALPFPAALRWFGLVLAVSGFALLQWAHQALSKNWSDTPRLMKDQTLITSGPYQWIRHPIYTAFILIMSATLFLSANWFIGLAWVSMATLDILSRISFEEGIMLDSFGDQYRAYMKRTGRLLPRF
ncbi:MAG: isoprenylcysteine carboxylmethyltransferase family protein [Chloroflexi bacterium]|nr:isoprenylcysteine carboxylmethyltransferase family protein [Chloroflexota bacterium]MCI0579263.1 isoprenylcysteine carboxylmethyltransferase family protein [Chloroflexota bacterium]MCI0643478.1 isoprenylcysteine carboxylmethyltransferase family protein [Chloroflexota bacterium]